MKSVFEPNLNASCEVDGGYMHLQKTGQVLLAQAMWPECHIKVDDGGEHLPVVGQTTLRPEGAGYEKPETASHEGDTCARDEHGKEESNHITFKGEQNCACK